MTAHPPSPKAPENDPKTGLSPVVIAGALSAGAAIWLIIELIQRGL